MTRKCRSREPSLRNASRSMSQRATASTTLNVPNEGSWTDCFNGNSGRSRSRDRSPLERSCSSRLRSASSSTFRNTPTTFQFNSGSDIGNNSNDSDKLTGKLLETIGTVVTVVLIALKKETKMRKCSFARVCSCSMTLCFVWVFVLSISVHCGFCFVICFFVLFAVL